MKRKRSVVLAQFVAFIGSIAMFQVSHDALAGNVYSCEISIVLSIDLDGTFALEEIGKKVAQSFTIEIDTGRISGLWDLANHDANETHVYRRGSKNGSYHVVSLFDTRASSIVVRHFADNPIPKPFVAFGYHGAVYAGICKV